jgi:conjugal transfer pilus assembly protein TraD
VLGTTGTGKSRLLELLALQAVRRGDAVIVIDPKGDDGLLRRVRDEAGDRFRLFSLPHPERSVRYNPIGRFHDIREVADRIAALLPSSGDALPFRNFGWEIIHTAARELSGKQAITFQSLKRAAIDHPVKPLADRPREHYLKMANALIPILAKLSNPLLCPKDKALSWDDVDEKRLVVYFSLGSLLGSETSSAVAKTALLDLQSYVGARYAYSKGHGPIWLFVDELGDVLTSDFVSLLNKSRGAGLRIVACAQTASDLEASLGSRARALQVIGNANTVIQFRAQSAPDAAVFSEMSGERLVRTHSETSAYEPALLGSGLKTVDDFRARFAETVLWREHALVPSWPVVQLPTFHYFARWDGRVYRGRVPLLK